jgi:hypothetical protein
MTLQSIETIAGGVALIALVAAGLALAFFGLRDDLRERRRSYRRRGARPAGRRRFGNAAQG